MKMMTMSVMQLSSHPLKPLQALLRAQILGG